MFSFTFFPHWAFSCFIRLFIHLSNIVHVLSLYTRPCAECWGDHGNKRVPLEVGTSSFEGTDSKPIILQVK